MAIQAGCAPVLWQKIAGCCWVSVGGDDFVEVSPGVWQWDPGFDAGLCDFRWYCDDIAGGVDGTQTDVPATGIRISSVADISGLQSPVQVGDIVNYVYTVSNVVL